MKEPGMDLVKIEVTIPKAVKQTIEKLAALHGEDPNIWYETLIREQLHSLMESDYLVDPEKIIQANGLKELFKDPSMEVRET
jgi:hypothetical protein